ncbi:MAG: tol-pal system protein YbgF [Deltaproteobacteria bacterium]|nr:tol-pal system protein YbgF [Deltaproteobacteria bacterium]
MRPFTINAKRIGRLALPAFLLLFVSACATRTDFQYLHSQIAALDARVNRLQESIAEMGGEIDKVRADMQRLTGRLDENDHLIKRVIERDTTEKDTFKTGLARIAGLKARVRQLEAYMGLEPSEAPGVRPREQVPAAGRVPGGQPQTPEETVVSPEKRLYDLNLAVLQEGKYEEALDGFRNFRKKYPKSDLADNAQFWIGECYMAQKEYERAILAYQDVIKKHPKGNKAPSAMLRQALAFSEINDKKSSRLLLKKIVKKYPDSGEAKIARAKLKTTK